MKRFSVIQWFWSWRNLCLVGLWTFCWTGHGTAANFDIKPIKLFLGSQTRIEKLIVTNASEENLTLQIRGYQWGMDENGQDIYQETKDLVIFPKLVTLKNNEEKIIRIGTNLSPGTQEKTYRIFVEEIPTAEKEETKGSTVRVYLKIGVPLFFSPLTKDEKGAIETVQLNEGKARIKIQNKGNLHFMVTTLRLKGEDPQGKEVFSKEVNGWYILSGLSKSYEVPIPPDVCRKMNKIQVEVKTQNNLTFQDQLRVEKGMCGQSI